MKVSDWCSCLPPSLVVQEHKHVGSTYICDPAPTDTDIDILLLVNDKTLFVNYLKSQGWVCHYHYDFHKTTFLSLKKGVLNIIVTSSPSYYYRFALAADVCKKLNLLKKEDRCMVHDAIVKAVSPIPEEGAFYSKAHEDIPF